jgi:succinate dehydrogenase/fumarate reductase flavoprotein subunit
VALYDIVVVGSGGTGLMAAYAAAKAGARVLVLEKGKQLGGTTAMSVGTVAASATRLQREHGIDDNPDAHFEDMGLFKPEMANRDHLGFRRLLVDHAPETIALLEEMGVVFMGPLPEPPHRVPRLHAIIPHSRGFIDHLSKACARHGVDIKTSQRVMRLIYADDRVKGVVVETEQASAQEICAERGVILASGDFSAAGQEFKHKFMSGPLLDIGGINPLSTGDGQAMGLAVGGVVLNGDLAWGPELRFVAPQKPSIISRLPTWPMLAKILLRAMKVTPDFFMRPFLMRFVTTFLAPSPNLFRKGAILVNQQGERFCDERDRPQDHLGRQQPDYGYIIFGGEIAQLFGAWPNYISTAPGVGYAYLKDYEAARQDIVHKYDNLQDLAQRLSLSYEALKQAVDQHNSVAKSDTTLKPIQQGPYYALGPVKSWIVFSEGGLKIDMQFRVLDQNNKPIAGLFAAGSAGQGGVLLDGHGHHLGWAFTSGRLAGHNAAMMK